MGYELILPPLKCPWQPSNDAMNCCHCHSNWGDMTFAVCAWADGLFVVFEFVHSGFGAHEGTWTCDAVQVWKAVMFLWWLLFAQPSPPPPEFLPSFNPLCLNPVFPHPMSSAYFCAHPWSLFIRLFLITSPQLFPSRPSPTSLSLSSCF